MILTQHWFYIMWLKINTQSSNKRHHVTALKDKESSWHCVIALNLGNEDHVETAEH